MGKETENAFYWRREIDYPDPGPPAREAAKSDNGWDFFSMFGSDDMRESDVDPEFWSQARGSGDTPHTHAPVQRKRALPIENRLAEESGRRKPKPPHTDLDAVNGEQTRFFHRLPSVGMAIARELHSAASGF